MKLSELKPQPGDRLRRRAWVNPQYFLELGLEGSLLDVTTGQPADSTDRGGLSFPDLIAEDWEHFVNKPPEAKLITDAIGSQLIYLDGEYYTLTRTVRTTPFVDGYFKI